MSTPIVTGAPIGGQFISSFGGLLGFIPYSGQSASGYNPVNQQTQALANSLDFKRADLEIISFGDDTTGSGSFGAEGYDKTAEGWQVTAQIIWDLRYPPDMISKNGQAAAVNNFNRGFQLFFFLGDDANYPSSVRDWTC